MCLDTLDSAARFTRLLGGDKRCRAELFTFLRWSKSSLAGGFSILLEMGGNHVLVDVYYLSVLAVVTKECEIGLVPRVKAHKG